MACKTSSGLDIITVIETLMTDIALLKRFIQGERDEMVPLGDPVATPTPTLRHLAKNVLDAIDWFQSNLSFNSDPLYLDSYAFNVRRNRIIPDDIPAGSVVTLPVTYYPGRDILLVMYRGEVCTPKLRGDFTPGERQYEEIAGEDVPEGGDASNYPSNKVLISFDMKQGSNLDCWVVASNLMREMGTLLAARDVAVQASETATEQAGIATDERETVQAMVTEVVLETGVANNRVSFRADRNYEIGEILTLPIPYYPRRNVLIVTYKGEICTPYKADEGDFYMYHEAGSNPTIRVNDIILDFPVEEGDPFDVMVLASSVGRNIEAIAELASQVKTDASNAILASQSVFNKADKYYVAFDEPITSTLRNLSPGDIVSHLDFTNAGDPGYSIFAGVITFTDGEYLAFDVDEQNRRRFSLCSATDERIYDFYNQDSGWMVSGIWEMPKTKIVDTALSEHVPDGPSLWMTVLAHRMTTTPIDPEYNYLYKPDRSELTSVVTDTTCTATESEVTITIDVYNAATKSTSTATRTVPVASDIQPGVMPSEAYSALIQAISDIASLKAQGGKYIGIGFLTKALLDAYTIPASVNIGDFTYVEVDETHAGGVSRYICVDDDGKKFVFAYLINEAPPGIAGTDHLGFVKSAEADGKVFVEADGTQSVVGWSAKTTAIANNAANIASLTERVDELVTTPSDSGDRLTISPTPPSIVGGLWINTTNFCPYIHNGTTWVRLTGVYSESAGTGSIPDPIDPEPVHPV
jgi:hypothetical protein